MAKEKYTRVLRKICARVQCHAVLVKVSAVSHVGLCAGIALSSTYARGLELLCLWLMRRAGKNVGEIYIGTIILHEFSLQNNETFVGRPRETTNLLFAKFPSNFHLGKTVMVYSWPST